MSEEPETLAGRLSSGIRDFASSASAAVDAAVNATVIRVAVTGLSRAGKTTFITSTIHNLLAANKANTVEALRDIFGAGEEGARLKGIEVVPPAADLIPFFDYEAKLERLAADSPSWPERTDDLAQITLELEMKRLSRLGQSLGNRRIRLDILDYPGEWLIDLPMMGQSYQEWSVKTFERLRKSPRREIFRAFLEEVDAVDIDGAPHSEQIRRIHGLYRASLLDARDKNGLRYLQPGRFLCPGSRADVPFMWFFPLPLRKDQHLRQGSAGSLLRDRFEAYKTDMRTHFFDTFFTDFDRQVVLVDVLGAMHAGKAAFDDTADAITEIAGSMSYGMNTHRLVHEAGAMAAKAMMWHWSPMLGRKRAEAAAHVVRSRRIERLAFVATKADHVPAIQRDYLKNLLQDVVRRTIEHVGEKRVSYHVAASVLSTTEGIAELGGRPVDVVMGVPLGEQQPRAFYPGSVPASRPPESFWDRPYFELPVFKPPAIAADGSAGIPHIGLDQVWHALLRDVLE